MISTVTDWQRQQHLLKCVMATHPPVRSAPPTVGFTMISTATDCQQQQHPLESAMATWNWGLPP